MKKYYSIGSSIDESIIGKSDRPITVDIKDEAYSSYAKKNLSLLYKIYYENDGPYLKDIPDVIHGEMHRRKKPIDFMDASPYCLSQECVVSRRFLDVLESIVDPSEYKAVPVIISGISEPYYMMFFPKIPSTELILPDCVYSYSNNGDTQFVSFNNIQEVIEAKGKCMHSLRTIALPQSYAGRDIINVEYCIPCFSKRLVEAITAAGLVGMVYYDGGCFEKDVIFR